MDHYVNVCLNLDKRDSEGNPSVTKTPKDYVTFSLHDLVILTVSVIEEGAEKTVKTLHLWNGSVRPDPNIAEAKTT